MASVLTIQQWPRRQKRRNVDCWNMILAFNIRIKQYNDDSIAYKDTYSISQEIAHGFCFAVLCCGYTLTDFPISIRLTSLALWQSNDCPSASKATLMNMDKYFMWIHYERLHNHNKAKHNKTVCIFLGIYCIKLCGVVDTLRSCAVSVALRWLHNDYDGVSNHQAHHCLLNRLFRRRSRKTSKLRVTGLCVGKSPGPVNSPHKGPVTRKMFPFDDVIMRKQFNVSICIN